MFSSNSRRGVVTAGGHVFEVEAKPIRWCVNSVLVDLFALRVRAGECLVKIFHTFVPLTASHCSLL